MRKNYKYKGGSVIEAFTRNNAYAESWGIKRKLRGSNGRTGQDKET